MSTAVRALGFNYQIKDVSVHPEGESLAWVKTISNMETDRTFQIHIVCGSDQVLAPPENPYWTTDVFETGKGYEGRSGYRAGLLMGTLHKVLTAPILEISEIFLEYGNTLELDNLFRFLKNINDYNIFNYSPDIPNDINVRYSERSILYDLGLVDLRYTDQSIMESRLQRAPFQKKRGLTEAIHKLSKDINSKHSL